MLFEEKVKNMFFPKKLCSDSHTSRFVGRRSTNYASANSKRLACSFFILKRNLIHNWSPRSVVETWVSPKKVTFWICLKWQLVERMICMEPFTGSRGWQPINLNIAALINGDFAAAAAMIAFGAGQSLPLSPRYSNQEVSPQNTRLRSKLKP